jgi:hypothetical protein
MSVEERLERLEAGLVRLQEEVRSVRRAPKDWRRTIGAFTDDAAMLDILREAMRLREQDRKKTRAKHAGKRKPKR